MPSLKTVQGQVYYQRAGRGSAVVLLHQYFGTSDTWMAVFDTLRRHFDVIAPDLRAHGRTSDPGGRLTLADFTADVIELLRSLDIRSAHLIGASLGAMVAARLALAGALQPLSLTLIGAPNFSAPSTRDYTRQFLEEIFPNNEPEYTHLHRALGPRHARTRLLDNFVQDGIEQPLEMREWYRGIEELRCPTLLLAGDNDPVAPVEWLASLAGRLQHGELGILPRGGHFPHRTLPTVTSLLLLDFLLRAEELSQTSLHPTRMETSTEEESKVPQSKNDKATAENTGE